MNNLVTCSNEDLWIMPLFDCGVDLLEDTLLGEETTMGVRGRYKIEADFNTTGQNEYEIVLGEKASADIIKFSAERNIPVEDVSVECYMGSRYCSIFEYSLDNEEMFSLNVGESLETQYKNHGAYGKPVGISNVSSMIVDGRVKFNIKLTEYKQRSIDESCIKMMKDIISENEVLALKLSIKIVLDAE